MPVTAATQPWSSTTSPGPDSPDSSGAATPRNASSLPSYCRHRLASASFTAVPTSATVVGCTVSAGPLTSTTPSISPVRGSWTGQAVHVHVVGAHEVLGGEHLHGRALGERGADRVAADHAFRPVGALGEPERVGAVADGGGALPPEQHPVGVGDDHDVPRVLGDRGQRGAELGQHALQRGAHPALLDLVGGERTGRVTEVGIHALRPRPHPRAGDEPPRIGGRAVAGEQGVVDAREHSRVPDDVRARPDRADRLVHPHHPEPPDLGGDGVPGATGQAGRRRFGRRATTAS